MYEFGNTGKPSSRPLRDLRSQRLRERDHRLLELDDDQLDDWQERVAICTVDGGLSDTEAEAVAWRQVDDAHIGPSAATAVGSQGRGRAVNPVATVANVARQGRRCGGPIGTWKKIESP
jgi:hypothetical protein